MKGQRRSPRILVPIMPNSDTDSLVQFVKLISPSHPVLLMGLVPMPEEENLSSGARPAREIRALIQDCSDRINVRAKPRVRVTYTPWEDIKEVLRRTPSIEIMALDWSKELGTLGLTAQDILSDPPCDIALIKGPFPSEPRHILIPTRGGPHAEKAFQIGSDISEAFDACAGL